MRLQHAGSDGIEIKASRYSQGWQGHNPENVWLMVFVFQTGRESPKVKKTQAFKFLDCCRGAAIKRRLVVFGKVGNQPKNHHSQRHETRRSKDDGELDLQVQGTKLRQNWSGRGARQPLKVAR